MTDYHIHIGQFNDTYYYPRNVIAALVKNGISEAYVSSTTSCIDWATIEEKEVILSHIKAEIDEALYCSRKYLIHIVPLYWVIPKQLTEGDTIEHIFSETAYAGFKIHTKSHEWNLNDSVTMDLMHSICGYAEQNLYPILIHTGVDEVDSPKKFEKFYSMYPNVKFILAHCRNMDSIKDIFAKHDNVYGDSSFCPLENIEEYYRAGFKNRILFGTDFPITCYSDGELKTTKGFLSKAYAELINTKAGFAKK